MDIHHLDQANNSGGWGLNGKSSDKDLRIIVGLLVYFIEENSLFSWASRIWDSHPLLLHHFP